MAATPRPIPAFNPGGDDATVLTVQDGHDATLMGRDARNPRELGEMHHAAELGMVEVETC